MPNTSMLAATNSFESENVRNVDDRGLVAREALEEEGIAKALHSLRRRNPQTISEGQIVCADCYEPIPTRRLELMPNATRCVNCQEAVEKDKGRR